MRAVFIEKIDKGSSELIIEGSYARHLIKVVRVKEGEKLLVLDGKGTNISGEVSKVEDKKVILKVEKVQTFTKTKRPDLALGMPKKEAFEDVIRSSVELGLGKIIPVKTEFSQMEPKRTERLTKLIESALIQSNNPFMLELDEFINFKELMGRISSYDKVLYFCSHQNFTVKKILEIKKSDKILMIIGPEGGLSLEEEKALSTLNTVFFLNLPSYILKTQTAVSACSGWVFAKMPT